MIRVTVIYIYMGLASCCVFPFKPYVRDINNLGIPKRNPFSISKQPFVSPEISNIDTNTIYLVEEYDMWLGPRYIDTLYYYYVFFQNGAFFKSTTFENVPTSTQINTYSNGFIGQYRYSNDTTIITQVYYPIECGEVYTSIGEVFNDKIIMNQETSNSMIKKYNDIHIILRKVDIESLTLQPYWHDYTFGKKTKGKK